MIPLIFLCRVVFRGNAKSQLPVDFPVSSFDAQSVTHFRTFSKTIAAAVTLVSRDVSRLMTQPPAGGCAMMLPSS